MRGSGKHMCRRAGLVVLLAMAGPACGRTAGQVVSTVTLSRPHTLDGLFTTREIGRAHV